MSTIDPSTIDPTKPQQGQALTANVRANEQATQDNFTAAKIDVEALEATAPTADQKAALDNAPTIPNAGNPFATVADAGGAVDVLTLKGDLLTRDATGYVRQPAGADGTLVGWDSGQVTGLAAIDPATVGTTVHADLTGLGADDHTQYYDVTRGNAQYYPRTEATATFAPIGHVGSAGAAHGEASGVQAGFISAGDKSKLDGVAVGADVGDMLQSVYDSDASGIVNQAETIAAVGVNNTGSTINRGVFVQADVGGDVSPAEPTSGAWAIGVLDETLINTASGRVMLEGLLENVDTSAGATGDSIYLAAGGTWTTVKPIVEYQRIGTIWRSHATIGSIVVVIEPSIEPETEGSTGALLLTQAAGSIFHSGTTAWTEVVPGAGETVVTQLINMQAGTNPGRLQFDYSGTSGPQPGASSIGGLVTAHLSVEFGAQNNWIEMSLANNGTIIAEELSAEARIGGNQTVGTAIPVTIAFPISGWSDLDEISIVTRGTNGASFIIHTMSVSFMSAEGSGGGGGAGGTNNHPDLLGRSTADSHPQNAITGLVADLASKALQASLDAHTGAATGAHAASAVSVVPTGGLAATNVQGGLAELDSDLAAHVGTGGASHALAVPGGAAGFMSGADKLAIDQFSPGYDTIQNDGANVAAETILNAAGGLRAAAGTGRTDISVVAGTALTQDIDGLSVDLGPGATQAAQGSHGHADVVPSGASGFMDGARASKLDGVEVGANDYSHPNHTGDVTSVGDGAQTIALNAVGNTKLDDMSAYTIKVRDSATPGDPQDEMISQFAQILTPGAGDLLMAQNAAGALAYVDVDDLPGGGITGPGTTVVGNLSTWGDTGGNTLLDAGTDVAITGDPSRFTVRNDAAGVAQFRFINDSNASGLRVSTVFQGTSGFTLSQVADNGVDPIATVLSVGATASVDFTAGPPTHTGGARVMTSSVAQTVDNDLMAGDATDRGVKPTGIAAPDVVLTSVAKVIEEVGITGTPTLRVANASAQWQPQIVNNQWYRLTETGGDATQEIIPPSAGTGASSVFVRAGVTVALSGWDQTVGAQPASDSWLEIRRIDIEGADPAIATAAWVPSA